jgi:hypothetical protein
MLVGHATARSEDMTCAVTYTTSGQAMLDWHDYHLCRHAGHTRLLRSRSMACVRALLSLLRCKMGDKEIPDVVLAGLALRVLHPSAIAKVILCVRTT